MVQFYRLLSNFDNNTGSFAFRLICTKVFLQKKCNSKTGNGFSVLVVLVPVLTNSILNGSHESSKLCRSSKLSLVYTLTSIHPKMFIFIQAPKYCKQW